MLSRDWMCLNERCRTVFHSFERGNPECPACGNARVNWVPGGGHVGKQAPQADKTLRSLADNYGMANLNSGSESRLNRAMPKVPQPVADLPIKQFAPGFAAPVSSVGATCEPSHARVDFKVNTAAGQGLSHSKTVPGPAANAVVHARHISGIPR